MKTQNTKLIVSVVAFVAVVGGILGFVVRNAPVDSVTAPVTTPIDTPVATVPATLPTTGKYKDGVYEATGNYQSPAGFESVLVNLTLKDGVVVATEVTSKATNGKSIRYQNLFIGGYKPLVIGKSIDTLKLVGAVSGSSLTPIGFNDALTKIKLQAQG